MGAGGLGDEEVSTLGLGELAQLTVNNEAEAAYDVRIMFFMFMNVCRVTCYCCEEVRDA
jgi:hypothetical protein